MINSNKSLDEFIKNTRAIFENGISATFKEMDMDSPLAGLLLQTSIVDTAKFLKESLPVSDPITRGELINAIDKVTEEMLDKYLEY